MTSELSSGHSKAEIGIIGGTGMYLMEGLEIIDEIDLKTPFGKPSDKFIIGQLEGKKVSFLNRHGRGHSLLPHEINYRANIYGFKVLGVTKIISTNSVGSLKEGLHPRDIVLPDQFYDKTHRKNTFFGGGLAAHISLADPVCPHLSDYLYDLIKSMDLPVHKGGCYICIEGPSFSTIAESNIYRSWGCDVIGMTSATEAKLAREAEMCYVTMNFVTDYDVWHAEEETVSVEMILKNLAENTKNAKSIIKKAIAQMPEDLGKDCTCLHALENTFVTRPELIPQETKHDLRFLIEKYFPD
ncbi:MAG: S-methyl-5'-thioadenosine phosphorylase [Candidatus Aminicenantes bacterium]|nr:S-methyl-5'-thioadenosine phosphorylase [Candidatus Aminicenantes bacterium]